MGNRSSTHYPPPLEWSQGQYTSYHSNSSGPHDIKRNHNGLPGAYAEPYALHPILRRSMMSLNADSGYLTSPSDSERMRLSKGSRTSLNHLDFEQQQQQQQQQQHHQQQQQQHFHQHQQHHRPLVFPTDLKTIKKLEKMEKKQQKLLKKISGRSFIPPPSAIFFQPQPMPPPPPPPAPPPLPIYSRAMSFDDLHRNHVLFTDPRQQREVWRAGSRYRSPAEHVIRSTMSNNHTNGQTPYGSSMASSPVTSVSDGRNGDVWRSSPVKRNDRDIMSPTSETSAITQNASRTFDAKKRDKSKSVEIKVERTERVERREKIENKDWLNSNDLYAMPRMQPSLGSRSSLATSQARGESSDIDFSWIREEENKLRKESENVKQLPKCYFGMDPPKLEDTRPSFHIRDEKENRCVGNGIVKTTAAAFENEVIREKLDQMQKSRSYTHLDDHQTAHSAQRDMGPMARRFHRMQREADVASRNYDEHDDSRQRWRTNIAN